MVDFTCPERWIIRVQMWDPAVRRALRRRYSAADRCRLNTDFGSISNAKFFWRKIQLCVNYGSHILLSIPFPSNIYYWVTYINLELYRIKTYLDYHRSFYRNRSLFFSKSRIILFWTWKWKYRSLASSVLILLNLFSKSMILTKYLCAHLQ